MEAKTGRVAINGRYSTDKQREASIADQVEICRRYAERQGWTVTGVYDDAAMQRRQPVSARISEIAGRRRKPVF